MTVIILICMCFSFQSTPAGAGETPEALPPKGSKKGDPVDEDVDIGDEMPVAHYPSVEIEKENSSSSSGSSSSSDSSSSSSSGNNNCGDNAKNIPVLSLS